jgi:arylsulfatase A-like enzyme
VKTTVSLRDLPATIVDVLGLAAGSPFPGSSLAGLWSEPGVAGGVPSDPDRVVLWELAEPNPAQPNQGRSPAARGPLFALADGGWVYIRNAGDGTEELFDERDDPRELSNKARSAAMQPALQRLRQRLDQLVPGRSLRRRGYE